MISSKELDMVQKVIKDYTDLTNSGKMTIFCWIPSNINIRRNQRADAAAKSAVSLPITIHEYKTSRLQPYSSYPKLCLEEWQDIWNCCLGIKLHAIYPNVGSAQHSQTPSCHEAVVINRLRLGHSRQTLSYLLSGNDLPLCIFCWNAPTWRSSDANTSTSISLLREFCLKVSTVKTSLILLKKLIFTTYSLT